MDKAPIMQRGLRIPVMLKDLYRPPFIGILALLIVFLSVPIGHSAGVILKEFLPHNVKWLGNALFGLTGFAILLWGVRNGENEVKGTLAGFMAAKFLFIGWASYSFAYSYLDLGRPSLEVAPNQSLPLSILTLQGSFGMCVVVLLFFVFNKNTKCNAFRWLQRIFRLNLGKPEGGQSRNFARITFIEMIFVTWFCYGFTLLLHDERFFGYSNISTHVIVYMIGVWSLYLLWKLCKFSRVMAALRYAIPTKALFWFVFGEYGPKQGWYKDFWIHPDQYYLEILAVLVVCGGLLAATAYLPQRKQSKQKRI